MDKKTNKIPISHYYVLLYLFYVQNTLVIYEKKTVFSFLTFDTKKNVFFVQKHVSLFVDFPVNLCPFLNFLYIGISLSERDIGQYV